MGTAGAELDLHARVVDGFTVEPGTAPCPDAALAGTPTALARVVYGGRSLSDAVAAGDVAVSGDRAGAERFLTLFSLPDETA